MQQRINQIRSQTPKSKFYIKEYVKVLDGANAQERKLARDRHRMIASLEAAASASKPANAATETSAKHKERAWRKKRRWKKRGFMRRPWNWDVHGKNDDASLREYSLVLEMVFDI